LVPRDHPVIPPANLEAEASGLLDRLLGVLQDNLTDPLIVTATLNALSTLVQKRASVSSKILATVLQFNPLKLAGRPMSGQEKIAIRSMTRTTMAFLTNCLKRNPNSTFASRLQQQVERLKHHLTEIFSNQQLKRPAPDEPVDGLDDAKGQWLGRVKWAWA
jgi:symplekin